MFDSLSIRLIQPLHAQQGPHALDLGQGRLLCLAFLFLCLAFGLRCQACLFGPSMMATTSPPPNSHQKGMRCPASW